MNPSWYYTKQDWNLYGEKLPQWQEAYMDRLNHGYIALPCREGTSASARFWALDKRIRAGREKAGVTALLCPSDMPGQMAQLIADRAISFDGLAGFRAQLVERVHLLSGR